MVTCSELMLCPTRPCWTGSHCTPVLTSLPSWTGSPPFAPQIHHGCRCLWACALDVLSDGRVRTFCLLLPPFETNSNSSIYLANSKSWQLLSSLNPYLTFFAPPPTHVFCAALMLLLGYSRFVCPDISSVRSRVGSLRLVFLIPLISRG